VSLMMTEVFRDRMLCLVFTDISEKCIASIFQVAGKYLPIDKASYAGTFQSSYRTHVTKSENYNLRDKWNRWHH